MINTNDEAKKLIDELYKENYKKILNMVRKNTMCATVAEDIVQDTFLEALRNAQKVSEHENPGGWLMETAKRKTMAMHRRMQGRTIQETEEVELELKGIEAEYGVVELHMIMDSVLNTHEKTLLHMFYFCGYSARELAAMEGITEGNFKVRLLRIRNKLKAALKSKK